MLGAARFLTACALTIGVGASMANAAKSPDPLVESILSRSLTERGGFHACALFEKDTETAEWLTRSWRLDMEASIALLRGAGYPDDYLSQLQARMTLEAGTPQFRDDKAAAAYCAAIGDWKYRFEIFLVSFPQFELKRRLEE